MTLRLMVCAGLPGTGKSTLAEALGRALGCPVFAKDWLEAALWRTGINREMRSSWASYELLSTLAERQLRLGQSAILDAVAGREAIRRQWRDLAAGLRAGFFGLECVCSDEDLHRARLAGRQRGIPGWYELDWSEVERVRAEYEPWAGPRLELDMVRPLAENVRAALTYLKG